MPHQLTTVLRRLGVGRRSPVRATGHAPAPGLLAAGLVGGGPAVARATPPRDADAEAAEHDVVQATADRARALLSASDRARFDALVAAASGQGPAVLARTLAATWSVAAAAEMAQVWESLPPADRRLVHDPVRRLARAGRQSDTTTCGSSVLTMLAAAGDPALALWLGTGRTTRTGRPPELVGAPADRLDALRDATPEQRFAPVHRVVKQRTNAGALLGLPWPSSLGTPPWGAAREARFVGVTFEHQLLDDTDDEHLGVVLDAVTAAVRRGVPVPLYSGGDTGRGVAAAVPRHLVLAVGASDEGLTIWEPGEGRVADVSRADLLDPPGPLAALGRWDHLTWAVLPVL